MLSECGHVHVSDGGQANGAGDREGARTSFYADIFTLRNDEVPCILTNARNSRK